MAIVLDGTDAIGDLGDALNAKLNVAGGKVLQVVRATDTTERLTTSTTFVDVTGLSVTITPQKSDSSILLISNIYGTVLSSTLIDIVAYYQITNSSNVAVSGAEEVGSGQTGFTRSAFVNVFQKVTLIGFNSPATTSPVTYKVRFKVNNASANAACRNNANTGQLYAIEVSA